MNKKIIVILTIILGLSSHYPIKPGRITLDNYKKTLVNDLNAFPACSSIFYNPSKTNRILSTQDHNVVYDLLVKSVLFENMNNNTNLQKKLYKSSLGIKVIRIPSEILWALNTILIKPESDKSVPLIFKVGNFMCDLFLESPLFVDPALEELGVHRAKDEDEVLKKLRDDYVVYCESSNARALHLLINNKIIEMLSKRPINTAQDFIQQLHRIVDELVDAQNGDLKKLHASIDTFYENLQHQELSQMLMGWNN